jgi:hypothetical protein
MVLDPHTHRMKCLGKDSMVARVATRRTIMANAGRREEPRRSGWRHPCSPCRLLAAIAHGGRMLPPKPRGSFVHHGGEPLSRFGALFLEALGPGCESVDLGA